MTFSLDTMGVLEIITYVVFLGGVVVSYIVYRAVQTSKKDKKENS